MESKNIETSICYLPVGMYLARLQTIPKKNQMLSLSVAPVISEAQIDFFPSPGVRDSILDDVDKSLVVRVSGKGRGALLVASSVANGEEALILKIDAISNALSTKTKVTDRSRSVKKKSEYLQSKNLSVPKENVYLLGHVAWMGDVKRDGGQWLGDPTSSKAIEGFSIHWENKPEDVDIAFSCRVKDLGRTPMALNGGFVGTRQKAKPILGLMLSLVGNKAANYEINAEVIFQGSEVQRVISGVECQGSTGEEPLVAMRLEILPIEKQKIPQSQSNQNNSNWTLHTV